MTGVRIPISADASGVAKAFDDIRAAMQRAGQEGKRLSDLDLSHPELKDLSGDIQAIQRQFADLQRLQRGATAQSLQGMARSAGGGQLDPMDWWRAVPNRFRDPQEREEHVSRVGGAILQGTSYAPLLAPPAPAAQPQQTPPAQQRGRQQQPGGQKDTPERPASAPVRDGNPWEGMTPPPRPGPPPVSQNAASDDAGKRDTPPAQQQPPPPPAPEWLLSSRAQPPATAARGFATIEAALQRAGQEGKRFRDLDLSHPELAGAAEELKRIQTQFEDLRRLDRTDVGRALRSMTHDAGGAANFDVLDWMRDRDRYFADPRERGRHEAAVGGSVLAGTSFAPQAQQQPQQPREESRLQQPEWARRLDDSIRQSWLGRVGGGGWGGQPPQPPGVAAAGAGGGGGDDSGWLSKLGGMGNGLLGRATRLGLIYSGVSSIAGAAGRGIEQGKEEDIQTGQLLRLLRDTSTDFDALRRSVRDATDGLGLTFGEGGRLTRAWASITNETSAARATEGMRTAAGVARGYGVDPGVMVQGLGRAQTQGEDPRRFALLIGETMREGRMSGRVEEVMTALLRWTETANKQLSTSTNTDAFATAYSSLNSLGIPGLRGENAADLLQTINAAVKQGGAAGEPSQHLTYRAFGRHALRDPWEIQRQLEGGMFEQLPDGTTSFQAMYEEINRMYSGLSDTRRRAAVGRQFGIGIRQVEALERAAPGGDIGRVAPLLQSAGLEDLKGINATAFADIGKIAGESGEDLERRRVETLRRDDLRSEDRTALERAATGDDDAKRKALVGTLARSGMAQDEGDHTRDAAASMSNALTTAFGALVPIVNDAKATVGSLGAAARGAAEALELIYKQNRSMEGSLRSGVLSWAGGPGGVLRPSPQQPEQQVQPQEQGSWLGRQWRRLWSRQPEPERPAGISLLAPPGESAASTSPAGVASQPAAPAAAAAGPRSPAGPAAAPPTSRPTAETRVTPPPPQAQQVAPAAAPVAPTTPIEGAEYGTPPTGEEEGAETPAAEIPGVTAPLGVVPPGVTPPHALTDPERQEHGEVEHPPAPLQQGPPDPIPYGEPRPLVAPPQVEPGEPPPPPRDEHGVTAPLGVVPPGVTPPHALTDPERQGAPVSPPAALGNSGGNYADPMPAAVPPAAEESRPETAGDRMRRAREARHAPAVPVAAQRQASEASSEIAASQPESRGNPPSERRDIPPVAGQNPPENITRIIPPNPERPGSRLSAPTGRRAGEEAGEPASTPHRVDRVAGAVDRPGQGSGSVAPLAAQPDPNSRSRRQPERIAAPPRQAIPDPGAARPGAEPAPYTPPPPVVAPIVGSVEQEANPTAGGEAAVQAAQRRLQGGAGAPASGGSEGTVAPAGAPGAPGPQPQGRATGRPTPTLEGGQTVQMDREGRAPLRNLVGLQPNYGPREGEVRQRDTGMRSRHPYAAAERQEAPEPIAGRSRRGGAAATAGPAAMEPPGAGEAVADGEAPASAEVPRAGGAAPRGTPGARPVLGADTTPRAELTEAQRAVAPEGSAARAMMDLIGKSEGTDRGRGYNETLGYGRYTGGDVDLTSKTLTEVQDLQRQMLAHPDNRWNSSAVGRYQIVGTTMRGLIQEMGLNPNETRFTPEVQDAMAARLMERRKLGDYERGQISRDQLQNNLAREWASLPTTAGGGAYPGQRSHVTGAEVAAALEGRGPVARQPPVAQNAPAAATAGAPPAGRDPGLQPVAAVPPPAPPGPAGEQPQALNTPQVQTSAVALALRPTDAPVADPSLVPPSENTYVPPTPTGTPLPGGTPLPDSERQNSAARQGGMVDGGFSATIAPLRVEHVSASTGEVQGTEYLPVTAVPLPKSWGSIA